MDALSLCTKEVRDEKTATGLTNWFAVRPAEIYPAAIAEIKEALQKKMGDIPQEFRTVFIEARDVGKKQGIPRNEAFALALKSRAGLQSPKKVDARAAALEAARRWFTRALKEQFKKPFGLHILKDEAYQL
jgi:hypothetical protein